MRPQTPPQIEQAIKAYKENPAQYASALLEKGAIPPVSWIAQTIMSQLPSVSERSHWDGPKEVTRANPNHPQFIPSEEFCYRCVYAFLPGDKKVSRGADEKGRPFWYHENPHCWEKSQKGEVQ